MTMKKALLLIPAISLAFAAPAFAQQQGTVPQQSYRPSMQTSPPISAAPRTAIPRPLPTGIGAMGLEATRAAYTKVLGAMLEIVTKAQTDLGTMTVPQGLTCTAAPDLQALIDELTARIAAVPSATTPEQLKALIADTATYMKTHKDDAKTAVSAYVDCTYTATVAAEKAYLASARLQAADRKMQGDDVKKLLGDIDAASKIVTDSQKQYAAATKPEQKTDALKTLASSAAYLQQIKAALAAPIRPSSAVPSPAPSIAPSSTPRSLTPRTTPPVSVTPDIEDSESETPYTEELDSVPPRSQAPVSPIPSSPIPSSPTA